MAVKTRGLGKGLDLLIPNAIGEEETKKTVEEPKKEEVRGAETIVKITKVEPNSPERLLMRMLCRSLRILSSSSA